MDFDDGSPDHIGAYRILYEDGSGYFVRENPCSPMNREEMLVDLTRRIRRML